MRWGRVAIALAVTAVLAWLIVTNGAARLLAAARPQTALSFSPSDARAKASLAEQLLTARSLEPADVDRARRLALEAAEREPTLAKAWRTIAITDSARGADERARRLFQIAQQLSRRDLPTQLWLIEERVADNDIEGALDHYDIALRTSGASAAVLLPILVQATGHDHLIEPIARLLETNPPWRRPFFVELAATAPSAENAYGLLQRLDRAGALHDRDLIPGLVERAVARGEYASAWRLYQIVRPLAESERLLRNGGFARPNPLPPFDWRFEAGGGARAEVVRAAGGAGARGLAITAPSDQGGIVAEQILLLPPGGYRLSARAGELAGDRPAALKIRAACMHGNERDLLLIDLTPQGPQERRVTAPFRIPSSGCPAQRLSIEVEADFGVRGVGAQVRHLTLERT